MAAWKGFLQILWRYTNRRLHQMGFCKHNWW